MNLVTFLIRREVQLVIKKESFSGMRFLQTTSVASATKKEVARKLLITSSSSSSLFLSQKAKRTFATSTHGDSDVNYNNYEGYRFEQDFDKIMQKASKSIEEAIQALKEARAKQLQKVGGSGIPPEKLSTLLEQAIAQEAVLSSHLEFLRVNIMMNARHLIVAVDAPDGTPDFEVYQNQREIQQIIDYAAVHEDTGKVLDDHKKDREDRARAMKILAVDGPDGISDDEQMVDVDAVANIIDFAAEHEDVQKVVEMHAKLQEEHELNLRVLAVDAPDGISDDETKIDKEAIDSIIEFAAEHEDVQKVVEMHAKLQEEHELNLRVLAVDAPDGISDDETKIDKAAVDSIIEFAAEHEDTQKVVEMHAKLQEEHELNLRVLAVDAPDGISDDETKIDKEAVDCIIEFAAEHEDVGEVINQHQRKKKEHTAQIKRIESLQYW